MNRQRIFRRSGQPLRSPPGPHALILLGIDNLSALEDLFGESLGDEIIEAVQARVAAALPSRASLWRAEHRRLALSVPQLDRNGVSALVTNLQISIAQQAVPTSQGPVAVTVAAGCIVDDDQPPEGRGLGRPPCPDRGDGQRCRLHPLRRGVRSRRTPARGHRRRRANG